VEFGPTHIFTQIYPPEHDRIKEPEVLSLDAFSRAKCIWRPGTARTRWGASALPQTRWLQSGNGVLLLWGREGTWRKGKGKAEGKEREGEGIASSLCNFWLSACVEPLVSTLSCRLASVLA